MPLHMDPKTRALYDSKYSRVFNDENKNWNRPTYNAMFLRAQEMWLNEVLRSRGHVFLNEVYDALGFPRVPSGQLIGWMNSEGATIEFRMEQIDDDTVGLDFNISDSDLMYHKI